MPEPSVDADSAAPSPAPSSDAPKGEGGEGKLKGGHDPRAMAQRSAEVRRQRKEEREEREREAALHAASGMDSRSAPQPSSERDETLAVLVSIRDDPKALNSDRIRAAQTIGQLHAAQHSSGIETTEGEQLRLVLLSVRSLPEGERLRFLREALLGWGEGDEHELDAADLLEA